MKKILALTGFFLVLSFWVFSQDTLAVEKIKKEVNPYAPTIEENALLWEISGMDLKTTSYLYGTIHMIAKDDFILTEHTKDAFVKSEQVTFEIDMNKMNDFSILFSLLGQVMMKDGMTLDKLLSEEDYTLVKNNFEKIGLPMFLFNKVKPMFLSTMASGDMTGGGDMESGKIVSYEMEFMEMAQKQEKEMAGLETIEYQMSVFDSIPYEDQAQMLVESIRAEDVGNSQFDEMVELYKNQDLMGMQAMFEQDEDGIGKYEDVFLKNRNLNWIPVMEKMMKQKPTFFAVGAGHLGGNIGVIALLREVGYILKPIR